MMAVTAGPVFAKGPSNGIATAKLAAGENAGGSGQGRGGGGGGTIGGGGGESVKGGGGGGVVNNPNYDCELPLCPA